MIGIGCIRRAVRANKNEYEGSELTIRRRRYAKRRAEEARPFKARK